MLPGIEFLWDERKMTIQDELKTKYENGELTRLQHVKRMAFTSYIYRYMYKALANGRGIVAVIPVYI